MIYLLEDDNSIRELVTYTLKSQGLEVKGFDRPSAFFKEIEKKMPDLSIIDIMLPEEDGLKVLEKLRKIPNGINVRILMLTAKSTEYDKVVGLNMGADDYLGKPFGMMELIARVNALLRRLEIKDKSNVYTWKNIVIDADKHQVEVDGENVELTLKEFGLLEIFVKNPGMVFSRSKLIEKNWGYEFCGDTRTVDVHVRSLRSKLKKVGSSIKTIHGIGYKLEK